MLQKYNRKCWVLYGQNSSTNGEILKTLVNICIIMNLKQCSRGYVNNFLTNSNGKFCLISIIKNIIMSR